MNYRIELLKKFIEEDPSDNFSRYALALEFMKLNENNLALNQLISLINDAPSYLPSYYMAGKLAEGVGKNSDAIVFYSKGIDLAREQKNRHTLSELQEALSQLEE